ncbi:hypothetical protein P8935_24055 [Telmatobacter sp. DSM 110680]|uniref:GcrA cell cycle regulator n=1 Tax=Telmatobacter sp. DSM 110680 TaxID=3036704 RepID=A0AAU7DJZ8_9BACT
MGKTATKESVKRVPFNWTKLKTMWDRGCSYEEISKSLDAHYNPAGDDPTKSVRAKCSVAMNKGIKIDGKLVRFKRRSKPHTEKELKPKPTATKQAKKPTTKSKVQKPKASVKKATKVTVVTPEAGKPVQPTEA